MSFSLVSICYAANPPRGDTLGVDRILVVVNDDVITQSELDARIPVVKKQLAMQRIRLPADEILQKQLLERMILERLQMQIASQAGIKISEEKVDSAMQNLAEQNHMTPKKFTEMLSREGMPLEKFRDQLRTQLTIQQLLEKEINNNIVVSDNEVENFLTYHGDADVEYNLSHILISVPEKSSPEVIQAAKNRAEKLVEQLKQGEDFEQAAVANSQDQKALEGGNLGWTKAGELPGLFVEALEKLQPGEISEPLRSSAGFHILKLNDKRGGNQPHAVTQSLVRHILIRPNQLVSLADAENKIKQLRARIEHGDDFAALAKANSDDTGSAANGGEIGWINPGQTVPEFERAVNALQLNELSGPVRSPFGVHLIQVLARRQQDISSERNQASARQQIHARKAEERYQQWLRQLRDEAFVEYRTDNVN